MLAGACARALPPPGGERDETPPAIIETQPEERAIITDLDQPVVFRFDERISERGARESILVSPATGVAPEVKKGRSEIRVEMPGGWKPDQVYRVVLLPGIRDLFGNERLEPAGLVFSTGPEIPNTAVAGVVLDRLTGRPAARGAMVEAARVADSAVYNTVGDSSAFYALTNLPLGQYRIAGFIDQNGNRRRDPGEAVSRPQLATLDNDADTLMFVLAAAPFDTTAARLTRAEARDSVEVRLTFDDALDPDVPLEDARVALFTLPDTAPTGGALRLMRVDERERERLAELAAARPDTTVRDTAVADTTVRELRRTPPGQQQADPDTAAPLPAREIVLITSEPLQPGVRYLVRAEGFTNVSGVPEGGGSAEFDGPERAAPPVRRDTGTVNLPAVAEHGSVRGRMAHREVQRERRLGSASFPRTAPARK